MHAPIYPHAPKSTSHLRRGQFWAIPLEDGRYGAGCVVGIHTKEGRPSSRLFIAGVVDWNGAHPPQAAELAGRSVVEFAFAHIKAITEAGGAIIGEAALQFSGEPSAASATSLPT